MFKRSFFAVAAALLMSVAAHAADRPTDQEILKAAQAQGILTLKTASGLPTDPEAWEIKAVLIDTEAKVDGENTLKTFAQIQTNADLFIESRKLEGKTLVTPTFQAGANISVPGTMRYQRVGLFTRSWEIKFVWEDVMPPGLKAASFPNAVSTQSDEGREISGKIAGSVDARIKEQIAEAAAKNAAFATDRQAAEEKMALARSKDERDIEASLTKFVGKWLPYTIVTPADDPKATKSDFRAVFIDEVSADGVTLTLLLGGDESASRGSIQGAFGNGRLNFVDTDGCEIDVVPSRKSGADGEVYMLFGSRVCSVARQHISILLTERTPKQVAEFVEMTKRSTQEPPPTASLPLPNLKP